jgi:hypothetical protein
VTAECKCSRQPGRAPPDDPDAAVASVHLLQCNQEMGSHESPCRWPECPARGNVKPGG